MKLHLLCFLCLSLVFIACRKANNPTPTPTPIEIKAPPAFGFYVVGYFPSYRSLNDVPD